MGNSWSVLHASKCPLVTAVTENQPDVDHLDVRGGGQALHLADEDGRHHQHRCQVHTQGCLKEEGLEEGGGKGDRCEENGGEIRCHQLTCHLSFQNKNHAQCHPVIVMFLLFEIPICYLKYWHIQRLVHMQLVRDEHH